MAEEKGRGEQAGALDHEVWAACPNCGGQNRWGLLQRLNVCTFCDSRLLWPEPEGERRFLLAEDGIRSKDDLLDVLQTYDAVREQARLTGIAQQARRDNQRFVPLEAQEVNLPAIAEIKAKRRSLFALQAYTRVYAPYLMVSVTLGFHALGRIPPADRKVFRTFFFVADDLLPAYGGGWNFRDEGLWVSHLRFRPLSGEDLAKHRFMRPEAASADPAGVAKRWLRQGRLLEPDLAPIFFDSEVFTSHAWWVYRPYYYVQAVTPDGLGWFLVDGQFRTLAGYPTAEEVERATGHDWPVMGPADVRPPTIRVVPFRCPECGWDVSPEGGTEHQLCRNCGRMLRAAPDGLQVVPYRVLNHDWFSGTHGQEGWAWLPFWRIGGSFALEGKSYSSLSELLDAVLGAGTAPVGLADGLCAPAFDVLTYQHFGSWSLAAASGLAGPAAQAEEGLFTQEFALGDKDRLLPPSLAPADWVPLAPKLLAELLPDQAQVRFNPVILRRLLGAQFTAGPAELIYAPFPLSEAGGPVVAGPGGAVGAPPLFGGTFPPGLYRSVKRWMAKAPAAEDR